MGKYTCIIDSQADTYIEECFERKCQDFKDSDKVINQWREDKAVYTSYTAITNFDFQHYSMHDKSHSVAILQNIEMILGQSRVEALCAGDLWLLLEAAYCHDIGMSVTYEKLCEIWESKEFQNFVREALDSELVDRRKAAVFYQKLNVLVHNRTELEAASKIYDIEEFNEEFDDMLDQAKWPVVCERYIMMLYTEYVRKKHHVESRDFMARYGIREDCAIPHRLYNAVAQIAWLHGEEFDKIFSEVYYDENGIGGKRMHPQFAAAMLRLGDLLDMDNNRFNIRMMKHMGLVPAESTLHLKKHKAMTHLSYCEGVIQAEARSDEFEVCKTADQWFRWLDMEVKDIICCWNKIAPPELYGCRLNRCELNIYLKGKKFDAKKQTKFLADPERVYKMLIGDNIYKSRLDFIREYLQNALDASKMGLWLSIKKDTRLWEEFGADTISPYDLPGDYYRKFGVEVEACIDWNAQEIEISFRDHGIGMEEKCVKVLSNIAGDSWQKRENYAREISRMPKWLRPTSGFGIGVQSAFMISDKIVFVTRSEKDQVGRELCLEGGKRGGRVSECENADAEIGTKVLIRVRIMDFLEEAMKNADLYLKDVGGNVYDRRNLSKIVQRILRNYITHIAEYSLLPVTIQCDREDCVQVGMKWEMGDWPDRIRLGKEVQLPDSEEGPWKVRYCVNKDRTVIWIPERDVMVIYMAARSSVKGRDKCYYKGILINDETLESTNKCSLRIFYYGDDVSRYLSINRDRLHQNRSRQFKDDIVLYKYLYARLLARDIVSFKKCEALFKIMSVSVLAYCGLGMITLSKEERDGLLASASRVRVKRVRPSFFKMCPEKLKKFVWMDSEAALSPKVQDKQLEDILFETGEIPAEELVGILEKGSFLFSGEKKRSSNRTSLKRFAEQVKEHYEKAAEDRENHGTEDGTGEGEESIYARLALGEVIIVEQDVCRILERYGGVDKWKDLKTEDEYLMRIACGVRSLQRVRRAGFLQADRVKKFICESMEDMLDSENPVPLALSTVNLSGEEMKYRLWVKKVFPGIKVFSLDNQQEEMKPEDTVPGKRYLMLPLTERTLLEIDEEIRQNDKLTKEIYDDIVRKEYEQKLLIEWTYYYLSESGVPKQKRSEIWNFYIQVLDLLYKEYFAGRIL